MAKQVETQDQDQDVTVSLTTVQIEVPLVLTRAVSGQNLTLNLASIPDADRLAMVSGLLGKGWVEVLRDVQSTTKGTTAEKDKAARDRAKAIQDGTYTWGKGGRGGPRLSPELDAWKDWLNAQRGKGDKPLQNKDIETAQVSKRAANLIAKGKATKENAIAMAKDGLDGWIEWMQENNPQLKVLVAAKRTLAGGQSVDSDDYD